MPSSSRASVASAQINYETFMGQVIEKLPPVINGSIYDMYKDAWEYCKRKLKDKGKTLRLFQKLLAEVPKWDAQTIKEETDRTMAQLPWLREVLRQMLVARVHILMSVRYDQETSIRDFKFDMPSNEQVVHKFLIRASKYIRGRPSLYNHQIDEIDRETNTMEAEELISKAVKRTISDLVPLEQIVERHLQNYEKYDTPAPGPEVDEEVQVLEEELVEDEDEALQHIKEEAERQAMAEREEQEAREEDALQAAVEEDPDRMQLMREEEPVDTDAIPDSGMIDGDDEEEEEEHAQLMVQTTPGADEYSEEEEVEREVDRRQRRIEKLQKKLGRLEDDDPLAEVLREEIAELNI